MQRILIIAGTASVYLIGVAYAGSPAIVFTDVTDSAGVASTGLLTESLAWGDFDGDGDEDLYLTNLGVNNLYRNDGGGVFTDVAAIAGVDNGLWSVGAAFGDLDNDGDLDLYVVNFGGGPDALYRNNGDGTFTDITVAAGTTIERSSRGMGFIDYDGDGLLDIYVNAIGNDILYHNQGGLTFLDSAAEAGIAGVNGQGVGFTATDVNGDGWVDIFTGNRSFDTNWLFLNNAGEGFTAVGASAGITQTGLGMGVLSLDFDNDLDFDLYWTAWPSASNAFYQNDGAASFTNIAAGSGTLDSQGWGISCNAGDVDNDGWEDFFVTNGFDASTSANVLFRNNSDGTFSDITAVLGGADFDGRGVAFADFDNDGDIDLCVTADAGEPTKLWRNDTLTEHTWLRVSLQGVCANSSGFGSRITVHTDAGSFAKEVSGGAGRGSFNSIPVEFGLGFAGTVTSIDVVWQGGSVQTLDGAGTDWENGNAAITIVERTVSDIAEPFGVLDLADIDLFVSSFLSLADPADLAEPFGVWDLSDIQVFIAGFLTPCD